MKKSMCLLFILSILVSSTPSTERINIKDIDRLKTLMDETETLIKKVEVLPFYEPGTYVKFYDLDKGINVSYSTLNYDPENEGEFRNNPQLRVDSYDNMVGLTNKEWTQLKSNLVELSNYGITSCNPPNPSLFDFLYYDYPQGAEIKSQMDMTFLAILSSATVNNPKFVVSYVILDEKEGLYLFRPRKPADSLPSGYKYRN